MTAGSFAGKLKGILVWCSLWQVRQVISLTRSHFGAPSGFLTCSGFVPWHDSHCTFANFSASFTSRNAIPNPTVWQAMQSYLRWSSFSYRDAKAVACLVFRQNSYCGSWHRAQA